MARLGKTLAGPSNTGHSWCAAGPTHPNESFTASGSLEQCRIHCFSTYRIRRMENETPTVDSCHRNYQLCNLFIFYTWVKGHHDE